MPQKQHFLAAAFSTAHEVGDSTSGVPCRTARGPRTFVPDLYAAPGPLPSASVKRWRIFTTQDAFHRQVLPRRRFRVVFVWDEEPATDFAVLPLAIRLPTIFRNSVAHARES